MANDEKLPPVAGEALATGDHLTMGSDGKVYRRRGEMERFIEACLAGRAGITPGLNEASHDEAYPPRP